MIPSRPAPAPPRPLISASRRRSHHFAAGGRGRGGGTGIRTTRAFGDSREPLDSRTHQAVALSGPPASPDAAAQLDGDIDHPCPRSPSSRTRPEVTCGGRWTGWLRSTTRSEAAKPSSRTRCCAPATATAEGRCRGRPWEVDRATWARITRREDRRRVRPPPRLRPHGSRREASAGLPVGAGGRRRHHPPFRRCCPSWTAPAPPGVEPRVKALHAVARDRHRPPPGATSPSSHTVGRPAPQRPLIARDEQPLTSATAGHTRSWPELWVCGADRWNVS